MRVLYDHQVFSLQDSGGGSRYHYALLRYMAELPDVQAQLLLGINSSLYPLQALESTGAAVTSLAGTLRPGLWRYALNEGICNSVAPFRGRMDVYHPTAYRCMPLVRARRVVVTHHDCAYERFPELFVKPGRIFRAKGQLYRKADAIICVSEASRKDLLSFYDVSVAKTRVIYHGLSPLARSSEAAEQLRKHISRPYVLFVGSRAAYKNFDGLLKGFHDAGLQHSLDLLVVGGGALTEGQRERIARLGLAGRVVGLPFVSDSTLAEAYAGAHLFVYPSLCEGFGFPPLEAMSVGCPVLASRSTSIPEVCQDAPFYFDGNDPGSFTRSLLRAVNDEKARRQAIEKGNEVVAQYSWEKCRDETLAFYRECQ
jgi:glycosyltransferase involved in cell wall biosynthesis